MTPGQADAEARAEDDAEALAVDAEDVDGALAAELRELADWYESSARHSKGIRANEQQLCANRIRAAVVRVASGNALAAQGARPAPGSLRDRVHLLASQWESNGARHSMLRPEEQAVANHYSADLRAVLAADRDEPQPAPELAEVAADRDRFRALLDAHLPLWEHYGQGPVAPEPAPELAAELDGLRKSLRAISLGIAEPSPKTVADNALDGRYFDPMLDSGVWRTSDLGTAWRLLDEARATLTRVRAVAEAAAKGEAARLPESPKGALARQVLEEMGPQ